MTRDELFDARRKYLIESGQVVWNGHALVCPTCGGNCGQCGITDAIGSPPVSMQALVDNLLLSRAKPWWKFW